MPVAPDQLDQLFTFCFQFAHEMLEKRGAFFPFGAHIRPADGIGFVAGTLEEHGDQRGLYQFLLQAFQASARNQEVLAIALAADVTIPEAYSPAYPDGVRVLIEADGCSRFVYVPYRLVPVGGIRGFFTRAKTPEFAEAFAVATDPEVFPPTPSA